MNTPLLSKQKLSTEVKGDRVLLKAGSTTIDLPYEAALQLSQWLRVSGKQAKQNAGDVSRHWSAVATLDGVKK